MSATRAGSSARSTLTTCRSTTRRTPSSTTGALGGRWSSDSAAKARCAEQTQRARLHGRNNTPLARLYDGFRRNDPGLNYLVPGNGQVGHEEKAREWASVPDGDPRLPVRREVVRGRRAPRRAQSMQAQAGRSWRLRRGWEPIRTGTSSAAGSGRRSGVGDDEATPKRREAEGKRAGAPGAASSPAARS